jgi:hypothetical protein
MDRDMKDEREMQRTNPVSGLRIDGDCDVGSLCKIRNDKN